MSPLSRKRFQDRFDGSDDEEEEGEEEDDNVRSTSVSGLFFGRCA